MKRGINRQGFTLLELLVVIGIIALIVSVTIPNLLGARERARDAQKKAGIHELKNALRLYFNDFNEYPASNFMTPNIQGCGVAHNALCSETGCFFAGAAACSDAAATVYMKGFPDFNGTATGLDWNYYSNDVPHQTFCMTSRLANTADADLKVSTDRCINQGSCTTGQCPNSGANAYTRYCACED